MGGLLGLLFRARELQVRKVEILGPEPVTLGLLGGVPDHVRDGLDRDAQLAERVLVALEDAADAVLVGCASLRPPVAIGRHALHDLVDGDRVATAYQERYEVEQTLSLGDLIGHAVWTQESNLRGVTGSLRATE